jgi:hypothetical protein
VFSERTSVGLDVHVRSAAAIDGVTGELFKARLTPSHDPRRTGIQRSCFLAGGPGAVGCRRHHRTWLGRGVWGWARVVGSASSVGPPRDEGWSWWISMLVPSQPWDQVRSCQAGWGDGRDVVREGRALRCRQQSRRGTRRDLVTAPRRAAASVTNRCGRSPGRCAGRGEDGPVAPNQGSKDAGSLPDAGVSVARTGRDGAIRLLAWSSPPASRAVIQRCVWWCCRRRWSIRCCPDLVW